MADEIRGRKFPNKWELSQMLVSSDNHNSPIGLSIAYYRVKSSEYLPFNSVYLHRGAIKTEHRHKGVGKAMVGFALKNAFEFVEGHPELFSEENSYKVTMQTNDEPSNRDRIDLYKGLGGEIIGKKAYPDKVDIIIGFTYESFIKSDVFDKLDELIKL